MAATQPHRYTAGTQSHSKARKKDKAQQAKGPTVTKMSGSPVCTKATTPLVTSSTAHRCCTHHSLPLQTTGLDCRATALAVAAHSVVGLGRARKGAEGRVGGGGAQHHGRCISAHCCPKARLVRAARPLPPSQRIARGSRARADSSGHTHARAAKENTQQAPSLNITAPSRTLQSLDVSRDAAVELQALRQLAHRTQLAHPPQNQVDAPPSLVVVRLARPPRAVACCLPRLN